MPSDRAWDRAQRVLRHPFLARVSSDEPDVTRLVLALASAALAIELAIYATTFLPGGALVPQAVVFALFVAVFPLHLRSVLGLIRLRLDPRTLLGYLPKPQATGLIAVVLGVIGVSLLNPGHLRGQPEHRNGQYYFNQHGSLISTDKPGYQRGVKLQDRGFTGIPATFFAVGVAVNLALLRRRRLETAL
jgi:hypothetical protein